jgi:peptide deformylase
MAVREILLYPDHKLVLRQKCIPVQGFTKDLGRLIVDLIDTLLSCPNGVGLAAPQVGDHRRVVVVRLGTDNPDGKGAGPPLAMVNPDIIEAGSEQRDFDGCLSFPDLYGETIRPHHLRVSYFDRQGKSFDGLFTGFDAVVVHHELDHLEGMLFIDRIERAEDLYRIVVDGDGNQIRVPISA